MAVASNRDSLRRRTLTAVVWSAAGNYGAGGVRFVTLLALGWLLPPSDFGLLALATVFIIFAEGIGELGLGSALVQDKNLDQRTLDTAFWATVITHLSLGLVCFLWAEPISEFLGDSQAAPLLRLLSLVFPIQALAIVPRAALFKELDFRKVSFVQMSGELAFATVGLTMATLGFGVWSLGGAVLAQRSVNSVILLNAVSWRPGFAADRGALKRLLRFGAPIMAAAVIERGLSRADYFFIGRFIGTEELGYYSLAFQLAFIPLDRLVGMTSRVAFPALAIVQDAPRQLASGLLEGLRHLTTLVLPAVLYMAILGPWILEAIYRGKWDLSVGPLRILALGGLFLAPRLVEVALMAVGRATYRFWVSLLRLAAFAALVPWLGIYWGIDGVAVSVVGGLAAWAVANIAIGRRVLGIRSRDFATAVWPAGRAGLAALAPLALLLLIPLHRFSLWLAIIYAGATMTLIYVALTLPRYRQFLERARSRE